MQKLLLSALVLLPVCALVAQEKEKPKTAAEIRQRPKDLLNQFNVDGNPAEMSVKDVAKWRESESNSLTQLLKKADKNGDGMLSAAEAKAYDEAKAGEIVQTFGRPVKDDGVPAVLTESDLKVYLKETDKEFAEALQTDWLKETFGNNLMIRKSLSLEKDIGEPAKVSWTHDGTNDSSFYLFDGAIGYQIESGDAPFFLFPNVEAHISSKTGSERDSIAYRLPAEFHLGPLGSKVVDQVLTLEPYYEMDRHNDVGTFNARLLYSPTAPAFGMGTSNLTFLGKNFYWRPWLGYEYGHVDKGGGVPLLEAEDNYSRLLANATAVYYLGQQWNLTASYSMVHELTGLEDSYNYWELSSIWYLDPLQRASVGVTYKNGEASPKFEDVDLLTIWFGFKY